MRGLDTCGGRHRGKEAGFLGDLRAGISDANRKARVVIGPVMVLGDYLYERQLPGSADFRVRPLGNHSRGCRRSHAQVCAQTQTC